MTTAATGPVRLCHRSPVKMPASALLVRTRERGLSGAILHGWRHTDATILGVMDADRQHPPELLPQLVARVLDGRDLAIGSRYATGGSRGWWNPIRVFSSAAAIWATRPLQPRSRRVRDPLSGFFIVRRRCVENLPFQPTGFKLLLESWFAAVSGLSRKCRLPLHGAGPEEARRTSRLRGTTSRCWLACIGCNQAECVCRSLLPRCS